MEVCKINEPLIRNINGVQFSIMGPDEIRNNSVVEVKKYDTYDKLISCCEWII